MAVFSSKIGIGYILAEADYTTNQFYAVKLNSSGKFELCDTLGESVDGIIAEPNVADAALGVTISGVEKVAAGAAVAAGANLSVDATGRLITSGTGHAIVGKAQSAAAAAGELMSVLLGFYGVSP